MLFYFIFGGVIFNFVRNPQFFFDFFVARNVVLTLNLFFCRGESNLEVLHDDSCTVPWQV
jgi:hypothetical protein